MALSVQNKNFLAVLNKLGIDLKQFPDKTFDGLFENVPDALSYFFNWFIENITNDNVLSESEQAVYSQMENFGNLGDPPVDFFSPGRPLYKEVDINYINNYMPQELEGLRKSSEELSDLFTALESSHDDVLKKQNKLKEDINIKKKQLIAVKEECNEMNLLLGSRLDEVKAGLLKEPHFTLRIDLFNELSGKEGNIFNELKKSKLLEIEIYKFSKMESLFKLEEDLAYVDISLILSEGFLKAKKAKVEFLSELLQKENPEKTLGDYCLINNEEGIETKIGEEIRVLESELFDKTKKMSHFEVQKIYNQYLADKIELNKVYLSKLFTCKDYLRSNQQINSCLLHILLKHITQLENSLNLRKQLFSKLSEYETNFTNDVTKLELRHKRFSEVSTPDIQHLLLSVINNKENSENDETTLKDLSMLNITKLMELADDESKFNTHKFRSHLQFTIKEWFDNTLCGPTSQLLFLPVQLLIKYQECKEQEGSLLQVMKRLACKYVEAKETISKSDRKRLLLWIDFLTNPKSTLTKCNTPQSETI